MDVKFYGIESRNTYYGTEFRFFSKYNGARGSWCCTRNGAREEGEQHTEIIKTIHCHNVDNCSPGRSTESKKVAQTVKKKGVGDEKYIYKHQGVGGAETGYHRGPAENPPDRIGDRFCRACVLGAD